MHRLESPVRHAKKIGPATVDAGNGVNIGSLIENGSAKGASKGGGNFPWTTFPLRLSTRSCCSLIGSRPIRGVKTKRSESGMPALTCPKPFTTPFGGEDFTGRYESFSYLGKVFGHRAPLNSGADAVYFK